MIDSQITRYSIIVCCLDYYFYPRFLNPTIIIKTNSKFKVFCDDAHPTKTYTTISLKKIYIRRKIQ